MLVSLSSEPEFQDFTNTSVLAIDDEPAVLSMVSKLLVREGFEVTSALNGERGVELARSTEFGVAIVDQSMPGMTGIETIRELKKVDADLEVVILTGHPSLESSLEAIQEHVFDYLCKPVSRGQLTRSVRNALERRNLVLQNRELIEELRKERNGLKRRARKAEQVLDRHLSTYNCFTGTCEPIARIRRQVAEVAPTDMTVLLRGESGTGKDVVARLIHELSGRHGSGTFVKINCPAIPETLLESELFGHEPGAFTGAERRKPGRFELAAGGTVYLDEIGEIPLTLQTKLLQVIEQKEFTRLGGGAPIHVEARIIAATNAPLEKMISAGTFRPDLFYRLNEYSMVLPPLRERRKDIPLLIEHFLLKHGKKYGHSDLVLSPGIMARLIQYPWPGNVRELEGVIRRFCLAGREESILESLEKGNIPREMTTSTESLDEAEAQTIMAALTSCQWNRREAANLLGISYSSLRRRIEKHNLKERAQSLTDSSALPPGYGETSETLTD